MTFTYLFETYNAFYMSLWFLNYVIIYFGSPNRISYFHRN